MRLIILITYISVIVLMLTKSDSMSFQCYRSYLSYLTLPDKNAVWQTSFSDHIWHSLAYLPMPDSSFSIFMLPSDMKDIFNTSFNFLAQDVIYTSTSRTYAMMSVSVRLSVYYIFSLICMSEAINY